MPLIKQDYMRMYKIEMSQAISKDTSGDFKKILVSLIGPD
jgi:hypothetical protein